MISMKRALSAFVLLGVLGLNTVSAEISLFASRVGAEDVPTTAEFYQRAFGLKEVNRIIMDEGQLEIMLNFGDTAESAMENNNAQVVIMHRDSNEQSESMPHLIFRVTDIEAKAKSIQDAGGTLMGEIFDYGDSGIRILFSKDPAGNQVELIQFPVTE